jgi:hypothetical protein
MTEPHIVRIRDSEPVEFMGGLKPMATLKTGFKFSATTVILLRPIAAVSALIKLNLLPEVAAVGIPVLYLLNLSSPS